MSKKMQIQWLDLAGKTGYLLAAGVLIPTYKLNSRDLVLVDSGSIPEPDLPSFFAKRGMRVAAVLQTHLHYDHTTNNRLLAEAFGTKFYASEAEINGELPPSHRSEIPPSFFSETSAKTAPTFDFDLIPIPDGTDSIELEGTAFVVEDLYGHSVGHLGFGTPDNVLCTGDALLSPSLVRYAKLPYFEYPDLSIKTMKGLMPQRYDYYALAHQEIIEARDIPGLVRHNILVQNRLDLELIELINEPVELDELVASVIYGLGIHARSKRMFEALHFAVLRRVEAMIRKGMLRLTLMNGIALISLDPSCLRRRHSFLM